MRTIDIKVVGRVQGVGYRYFCRREALELGLTGWARNMPGGDVTLSVTGNDAALEEFLVQLKRGPSYAAVESVTISESSETTEFTNFLTH